MFDVEFHSSDIAYDSVTNSFIKEAHMATSTCLKCGHHKFELTTTRPENSNFDMHYVQCSSCGSPIGVLSFFDPGHLLKEQEKEIADLKRQLNDIIEMLNVISIRVSS
jgi:ribosomal protein L37E